MARADSPGDDSPLSSMENMESSEDDFPDETTEIMEDERPTKRLRVGPGSTASSAVIQEPHAETGPIDDDLGNLSEDTEGDVPSSPVNARVEDDDIQEQITVCAWEGCAAGDMGNMDKLVEHIHAEHIESRAKKYTCEWVGCTRKSMAHASGYALKAHMRSHTREKPFYCYLPECDRAFTRSDALAKHMRTVHETEALRPSDPVPKSLQSGGPSGKGSKLRIILRTPQSHATGQDDAVNDDNASADSDAEMFTPLTEDQGFEPSDLTMSLPQLFKVSRKRLQWAEREAEELREEIKLWEEKYKQDWLDKEVLLDQVVKSEQAFTTRRKAVMSGAADVVVTTSEA